MSLDNEVKPAYITSNGTSVSSTTASSGTSSNQSTVKTPVFDKKTQEIVDSLGITVEEYLEITASNPEFVNLSLEKQLEYISKYRIAKQNAAVQTPAADTTVTENVQNSPETTVVTPTEETAQADDAQNAAEAEDTSWAKDYYFDSKSYGELGKGDKLKVFVEEYAKNKFLFSDSKNPRTAEAWNNLTEKERKELIKDAKLELKKELGISNNVFKKLFNKDITNAHEYQVQVRMSALQAANEFGMTLKEYYSRSETERINMLGEYLNSVNKFAPENLSAEQKEMITGLNTALEATKAALRKKGFIEKAQNISYGDIGYNIKKNGFQLGVEIVEYLTQKENDGTITNEERAILEKINDNVTVEALETFGIRFGEQTQIAKEIEDSKYAKEYSEAITPEQKYKILAAHAWDKYKDNPEKIIELINDANECGDFSAVLALRSLAKRDSRLGRRLAKLMDDNLAYNVKDANVANTDENVETISGNVLKKYGQSNVGVGLTRALGAKITDDQVDALNRGIRNTDNTEIAQVARIRTLEIVDSGKQREAISAALGGSEVTVTEFGVHADGFHPDNQEFTVTTAASKYDGRVAKAIIDNQTITRLDKKAQTGSFKAVQKNVEKFLSEKDAVTSLKTLADQISKCDVSNQLDMHKSITGSKYSDVQEYAASNIHTYDKSVQADALKVTYESGNTKAIEAANLQLDKCDAGALKSVEGEIRAQVQAMEARHTKYVASDISEKLTSMDAAKNPADSEQWTETTFANKRQEYKEMFMNADAAAKFRMIGKLPGVWQKEVIAHIATYCPELLSSLISSLGSNLFQLQLTPEVKNKIMLEMLRVPDMQADALEYFKSNPNGFSDSIKQKCAEMLFARRDTQLEDDPRLKGSLRSELAHVSTPDEFVSGGKVSNREYYGIGGKNDLTTFWKRDKNGYLIG